MGTTLTEMVAAIRFRLGNRKGIDGDIAREINYAQQRLEKDPTIEYWFLGQISSIVTVKGEAEVATPAGFLRIQEVQPHIFVDGFPKFIKRMYPADAIAKFGQSEGFPEVFATEGTTQRLYPTPDDAYVIEFSYIREEPKLEVGVVEENNWTKYAFQVLLNKAGIALAQGLRDQEALANFTNDFQVAFAELLTEVTAREESNFEHQRGGNNDALGNEY